MRDVDFGRHSEDYARHRPGPPASFYRRLDSLAGLEGSRAVDLGTGPGTIALELAAFGSHVTGVDISPTLIEAARGGAIRRGFSEKTDFRVGTAENTGLAGNAFDLVTAGQCWHWFDADAAMAEAHRILKAGGLLVIVYYSYLAAHSRAVRDTERLVLEFNPSWSMAGWTGVSPN